MSRIKSAYFPEIDGLRALAIAAVLLFHLCPSVLTGGFLGVDVFFVISGFLITRLILPQVAEGRFSFRQFYVRRAKRLLPVFLLTLVLTWVAAWWLFFPEGLQSLSRASFAAVFSFSNYEFAKQLDYFAPALAANPLLHTWSLAVEEQFYLLFPLLMVKTWRTETSVRSRAGWLAVIITGLFTISWGITHWFPSYAFYALESRAWELGIGCLTAILADKIQLERGVCWTLGWAGAALCVAAFVFMREGSGLPAPMALVPTVGAALLIISRCGGEGSVTYRVATWSPVRYLGRLSYSLYLFHWPVIVFYRSVIPDLRAADQGLCAVISLLLAMVVHHTVENPIRHATRPAVLSKLGYAGLALILLLATGSKVVRQARGYVGAPSEIWLRRVHPDGGQRKAPPGRMLPIGVGDRPAELVLIGDSYAQCLVNALDEALRVKGRSGAFWVAPATMPALDIRTSEYSDQFAGVLTEIAQGSSEVVVLCANWPAYIINSEVRQSQINPHQTLQEAHQSILAGLSKTVRMLTQAGKRVVLVHPIPSMDRHVPEYMARRLMAGLPFADVLTTTDHFLKANAHISELLGKLSQLGDVRPVYPLEFMRQADRLLYREGTLSLYEDSGHVTKLGARRIVSGVLSAAWP